MNTVHMDHEQEHRWVVQLLCGAVRLYQVTLGPLLYALFPGLGCRFAPSCSAYATACLHKHGVVQGLLRAAWRLLRCHPFAKGGLDAP